MTSATYRGMDRAAIDIAYNNEAAFDDVAWWRSLWQQRTAALRAQPHERLDVPYGMAPRQKIDLFPVSSSAPTVLFFHGGFWSRNDKTTFRFLRDAIQRLGCNAAFAGYALAPAHDFASIVADSTSVTSWLLENLEALGLARKPVVLVGWSAGAHLVAGLMDRPGIAGGLAISGIYDLEPMRIGSMNTLLSLDESAVELYSPARRIPARSAPLSIAYGASELPEFQRQSIDLYGAWAQRGLPVSMLACHNHHHHSVLDELHRPGGQLEMELARMVGPLHD